MNVLVKKMDKFGLLLVEFVLGTLATLVAIVGVPMGVVAVDPTLFTNPYVIGAVAVGILFFALCGYFLFIRPFVLYRRLPAVEAYSDGEFLYIDSKKKAKIPLSALLEATVYTDLPYLLRKEFISEILIHLFSEEYGSIELDIPGYGSYKMYFVSQVRDTASELIDFLSEAVTSADSDEPTE